MTDPLPREAVPLSEAEPTPPPVISFGEARDKLGKERERLSRKRRTPGACRHLHTTVDEHLRRVECDDCGETVDAFDVLLEITKHWEAYNGKSAEIRALEKQVAEYQAWERQRSWAGKWELRTDAEKKMSNAELSRHHNLHGHPPEKMRLTRGMMECYCGCGFGRPSHREMEAKVLAARRLKVRAEA